jgi:hypothetical protein
MAAEKNRIKYLIRQINNNNKAVQQSVHCSGLPK